MAVLTLVGVLVFHNDQALSYICAVGAILGSVSLLKSQDLGEWAREVCARLARVPLNMDRHAVVVLQQRAAQPKRNVPLSFEEIAQSVGLWRTPAHVEMVNHLAGLVHKLSHDKFKGFNGVATGLLVGAKGIGKTQTCRRFLTRCAGEYPDVVMAYANYYAISKRGKPHQLRRVSLVHAVLLQLLPWWSPSAMFGPDNSENDLLEYLERRDLRLMLVVDELDEMYRCASALQFHDTLGELQTLGNSTEGRVAVVLCGSSAVLPMLICANVQTVDKSEFRLLQSEVPNLNGNKYTPTQIHPPHSADLAIVQQLAPSLSVKDAREILFFAGANARQVTKAMSAGTFPLADPEMSQMSSNYRLSYARDLNVAILDKLFETNKDLMGKLLDKENQPSSAVTDTPWHDSFLPLTFEAVRQIWNGLMSGGKVPDQAKELLEITLLYLSDRGFLVVAAGWAVYPWCVWSVAERHIQKKKPAWF